MDSKRWTLPFLVAAATFMAGSSAVQAQEIYYYAPQPYYVAPPVYAYRPVYYTPPVVYVQRPVVIAQPVISQTVVVPEPVIVESAPTYVQESYAPVAVGYPTTYSYRAHGFLGPHSREVVRVHTPYGVHKHKYKYNWVTGYRYEYDFDR